MSRHRVGSDGGLGRARARRTRASSHPHRSILAATRQTVVAWANAIHPRSVLRGSRMRPARAASRREMGRPREGIRSVITSGFRRARRGTDIRHCQDGENRRADHFPAWLGRQEAEGEHGSTIDEFHPRSGRMSAIVATHRGAGRLKDEYTDPPRGATDAHIRPAC